MEDSPAVVAQKEAAKQAVVLAFAIITFLIFTMLMKPDSLKTLRMRVFRMVRTLAAASAERAGHISMRTELRTGIREYSLPYVLSRLRDKAAGYYEKEQ